MSETKRITSFTHLITGEGSRIAYTFSTINEEGDLVSQNDKGNYVVVNPEVLNAIDIITADIKKHIK